MGLPTIIGLTIFAITAISTNAFADPINPSCDKYITAWKVTGQDTFIGSGGEKYIGKFKDGRPDGQGTCIYPDGSKHTGGFKNGKKSGEGTYNGIDGSMYTGELKEDLANGHGEKTWPDGAKYIGEWQNGKVNGLGTLTKPNGQVYSGEWKDDQQISTKAFPPYTVPYTVPNGKQAGASLDASDAACLERSVKQYRSNWLDTEKTTCRMQDNYGYCVAWNEEPKIRSQITEKNICTRTISFRDFCGSSVFAEYTIKPGATVIVKFGPPCYRAY